MTMSKETLEELRQEANRTWANRTVAELYPEQLEALISAAEELERTKAVLSDPAAVWTNMLRGTIAKPAAIQSLEEENARLRTAAQERDEWRKDAETLAAIVEWDQKTRVCVCPTDRGCRYCETRQALEAHNKMKK